MQPDLFSGEAALPEGLRYRADLLSGAEESAMVHGLGGLPFREFEFHGFLGKRRVVSFGWRYDFNGGGLKQAEDLPAFLLPLRERAAAFALTRASSLQQVLVTEYRPGASIGWHRDRSVFGIIVGVSLLAPCTFRLRRRSGNGWQRASLRLEPRSVYLLEGPVRCEWEHSIAAIDRLRYSLTFRSIAA